MDLLHRKPQSFFKQTFSNLKFSNTSILEKDFEGCSFKKCTFIEVGFHTCKFLDTQFDDCVLSAVKPLNSSFMEVTFKDSKVMGVDWTKAKSIHFLSFFNSQIDYSNFSFLKLPKLVLKQCTAREVDLTEADLTDSNFECTDFEGAKFHKTNLSKANFKKAFNYLIDFQTNTLKKTEFSMPEVVSLLKNLDIIIKE